MITLKEVDYSYKSGKPILDAINLALKPGCIYGLLGKNGEGKTTLLKILSGLLFPQKGNCWVCGEIPSERKVNFLQQLFILPEEISFPDVTAKEYISMYAPFYPTFKDETLKACFESFEVDFSARLSKMSLGQRKKVAISLALAVHTPVLLMDEPTNGLDIPSKTTFRQLIASLVKEDQIVVISTHQVRDLESLIDSVVILDQKHILLNHTLAEIGDKLYFGLIEPTDQAFYSESSPLGTIGVAVRAGKKETPVSLELLFNAATIYPQEIKSLLNN